MARAGCWKPLEVEVVAESSDGKTLLVGESKLKLNKLGEVSLDWVEGA